MGEFCCSQDSNPQPKGWGQHPSTIRANLPFVNYHAPHTHTHTHTHTHIYIYIKSVHIHKILKQSFKQWINYNYFISKYFFFI